MTFDLSMAPAIPSTAAYAITAVSAGVFASETHDKRVRLGLTLVSAALCAVMLFEYFPQCDSMPWWMGVFAGCW